VLFFSALAGGVELLTWLAVEMVEHGVPLTGTTRSGQTAIHLAAEQGRVEALKW
jgi:hypothetical protein